MADRISLLRRFRDDASGGVALLGASFIFASIGLAAIVADWGSLYVARRDQQGTTDLAALMAARNLDAAITAASVTVANNGVVASEPVTVVLGNYTPDLSLAVEARFVAGGLPVNAARVTVEAEAPLFLGRVLMGKDSLPVVTHATAATTALGAFSVGSRLASLNNGVLNSVLGGLLGGSVSLSAMDYNALADSQVSLFPFLTHLATRSGLTVGTYSDLAATTVSVGDVIGAMADAGMSGTSAATAGTALASILSQSNASTMQLPAGDLIDLGSYGDLSLGGGSGLATSIRALPLLSAAAVAANGTNQVAVNLGASVPGLVSLSGTILVGERPQGTSWFRVGDTGTSIYTAQTRIRLNAQVAGTGLSGTPVISLPVLVDIAAASAKLNALSCGSNPKTDASVTIGVTPSVADLWIGTPSNWTNFSATPSVSAAPLVTVPLIATVSGLAHTSIASTAEKPVTFTWSDVTSNTIKTVSTTTPVTSLVSSLVQNTSLTASLFGLTLPSVGTSTKSKVAALLTPAATSLDSVLMSLLDALGVRIGEADVALNGLRCDGSVLVN